MLWRVTNMWQRAIRRALVPHGLTHPQFVLLASLVHLSDQTEASTPPTQRELSAFSGVDPMTTSQGVRDLEGRGLLERSAHPADGRARALAVTAAGRALAMLAVVDVEEVDRECFAVLGKSVDRLVDLLVELDRPHRG